MSAAPPTQTFPKLPGPPPRPAGARLIRHPASPTLRSCVARRAHVRVTLAQEGPPSPTLAEALWTRDLFTCASTKPHRYTWEPNPPRFH